MNIHKGKLTNFMSVSGQTKLNNKLNKLMLSDIYNNKKMSDLI